MLSTRPAARWLAFLSGLTLAFLFAGVSIAKRMGYRINTTPSVPAGIWRVLPLPARSSAAKSSVFVRRPPRPSSRRAPEAICPMAAAQAGLSPC